MSLYTTLFLSHVLHPRFDFVLKTSLNFICVLPTLKRRTEIYASVSLYTTLYLSLFLHLRFDFVLNIQIFGIKKILFFFCSNIVVFFFLRPSEEKRKSILFFLVLIYLKECFCEKKYWKCIRLVRAIKSDEITRKNPKKRTKKIDTENRLS